MQNLLELLTERLVQSFDAETLPKYHLSQFAFVTKALPIASCAHISEKIASLPSNRVSLGDKSPQTWDSIDIPQSNAIWEAFAHEAVYRGLDQFLADNRPMIKTHICWVHRYRRGEFIPEHKDACGSIQIVIPLKREGILAGGHFCLRAKGEVNSFDMRPGDIVVFDATKLAHWTTAIVADECDVAAERTALVCRFFASPSS